MAFDILAIASTTNVTAANLLPQVGKGLTAYDRASVPLQTIMMNMKRVSQTSNPTYFQYETQYDDPSATCSSGIAAVGAGVSQTIVIDSLNVRAGDRYLEPTTDQLFLVISITSYDTVGITTTCVVKRVPSTEATLVVAGTPLLIRVDNQMLEGDYYPEAVTNLPEKFTNGISVIAGAVSVTNIMNDTPSYYNQGSEFDFQRNANIEWFRKQMERNIIWSEFYQEQATHTHNGKSWTGTAYSTNGVINSIQTNIVPYTGNLTESTMDNFLANTVWGTRYYGGDYKIGFAGPQVFNNINAFAKNRMLYPGSTNMTYGLNVMTYIGYAGQKLYMILEREFMNDNPAYANSLVVLDPMQVELKYHGPALMMIKNTTPPDQTVTSIGLESRPGFLMSFEKSCAILQQGS